MDRLPRKSPSKGVSKKRKTYKLTSKTKSITNRKCDKWSLQNAYERVKFDLNISRCFMGVVLSLFKGDLEKIYKEPNQVKSNCDTKSVAMLATMILIQASIF